MIRAQFRICLPEGAWVTDLSRRYPDATFTLLSGIRTGDRAIELGETTTDRPEETIDAIRSHPSITQFELLERTAGRALSKYETTDTDLYDFVERSSLPVEFPIAVQDGWFEFDLTGTRADLETLRTTLESSDLPYELQSLVTTTDTETLLTDRQREVLETAVRMGYFEVPRECTLEDLAEAVGVDKATASAILRRGDAKLVKWFLTGPETTGRQDL